MHLTLRPSISLVPHSLHASKRSFHRALPVVRLVEIDNQDDRGIMPPSRRRAHGRGGHWCRLVGPPLLAPGESVADGFKVFHPCARQVSITLCRHAYRMPDQAARNLHQFQSTHADTGNSNVRFTAGHRCPVLVAVTVMLCGLLSDRGAYPAARQPLEIHSGFQARVIFTSAQQGVPTPMVIEQSRGWVPSKG